MGPLTAAGGDALLRDVFRRAGVTPYLNQPPDRMVPEQQAQRLFAAVREALGPERGDDLLSAAGAGTAHYVMQHRIPAPVRVLLRGLPAALAARLLVAAIRRNAWTFAGSGECRTATRSHGATVTIARNPLATPGCPWHVGVLETMFRTLVSPSARASRHVCGGPGESDCRFELSWDQATSAGNPAPPPTRAAR
jgi:divinyl protochlorophyllide a 8-vinyl-reductase